MNTKVSAVRGFLQYIHVFLGLWVTGVVGMPALAIEAEQLGAARPLELKDDLFTVERKSAQLILHFQQDMKIKYYQQPETSPMKGIYFQEGKLLTSDDRRDLDKSWCYFKAKLKLDENTLIPRDFQLPVFNVEDFSHNKTQKVLSYNFFDFETGKNTMETSRFVPFNFQCSIPKKETLTYENFLRITGGTIRLLIRRP